MLQPIKRDVREYCSLLTKPHESFPANESCEHTYTKGCAEHDYHVVFCDGHEDVLRCLNCGKEIITECTFDDDYD